MNRKIFTIPAALLLLGFMSGTAVADPVTWTDWTGVTDAGAAGTIGSVGVTVTGGFTSVQTECGTVGNYWTEPNASSLPYTGNSVVDNAPTACEMVTLVNEAIDLATITVTFDTAIFNPIMAIVSMGAPGTSVTYDFDQSFTVLSEGQGYWGDGSYTLSAGDRLVGTEFHGVIQFSGWVTSISWTSSPRENWHGFTFGAVASVPEPGTLSLLGLGLAGLGFSRRKKAA